MQKPYKSFPKWQQNHLYLCVVAFKLQCLIRQAVTKSLSIFNGTHCWLFCQLHVFLVESLGCLKAGLGIWLLGGPGWDQVCNCWKLGRFLKVFNTEIRTYRYIQLSLCAFLNSFSEGRFKLITCLSKLFYSELCCCGVLFIAEVYFQI